MNQHPIRPDWNQVFQELHFMGETAYHHMKQHPVEEWCNVYQINRTIPNRKKTQVRTCTWIWWVPKGTILPAFLISYTNWILDIWETIAKELPKHKHINKNLYRPWKSKNHTVHTCLWELTGPKQWPIKPSHNQDWSGETWNTATTFFPGNPPNETWIVFWRLHELEKVFIHEAFHWLEIGAFLTSRIPSEFRRLINHVGPEPLRPTEAWVEAYAIMSLCYLRGCTLDDRVLEEHLEEVVGRWNETSKNHQWMETTNAFAYSIWKVWLLQSEKLRPFFETGPDAQIALLLFNTSNANKLYKLFWKESIAFAKQWSFIYKKYRHQGGTVGRRILTLDLALPYSVSHTGN